MPRASSQTSALLEPSPSFCYDEQRVYWRRGTLMAVARGLFRLWVVVSAFWVAGVVIEAWRTFPRQQGVAIGEAAHLVPKPSFDPSRPYLTSPEGVWMLNGRVLPKAA